MHQCRKGCSCSCVLFQVNRNGGGMGASQTQPRRRRYYPASARKAAGKGRKGLAGERNRRCRSLAMRTDLNSRAGRQTGQGLFKPQPPPRLDPGNSLHRTGVTLSFKPAWPEAPLKSAPQRSVNPECDSGSIADTRGLVQPHRPSLSRVCMARDTCTVGTGWRPDCW